ncbi:MAG TPA: hypothetical protein VEI97_03355, partial [bacterium]|nr:hypothetical protein [bacterium]
YQLDLTRDQQPILDPALRLDPVTFQAIPIVVEPRSAAPTCVECHLSTGRYHATRPFTTNLTGLADDSPSLTLAFSYTGPATGASGTITLPTAEWGTASAFSPWGDPRLTAPLPAPAMGGVYQLHITADDGDQRVTFGPFGFQVVPAGGCPVVPPFSGTPVTTRGAFAGRGDLATLRPVEFLEPDAPPVLAVAGYRDRSGWLLVQGRSGEFYRYAPATAALEPATAGYPGPGWNNRAHLLDLDHRGHAIWVAGNIDQSKTPDPGLGDIYANAGSVVHLFNAAGPGPATAEWTSFDVGKPVVALCVDEDDAIWVVDNTNTLRRYTDTGGGYAEDIDSGIALGSATAGGILGESIYDIDLDYHNRAFFLVVKQLGDRLAVWRVECNGDLEQPNGHTNPVDDVTGGPLRDAAIAIDNYGVHGQVLTGQQDAQILVAVENGLGWLGILTSDLERTASWTGTQGASRLALLYREGQAVTLADQSGAAGSRLLDFWLMGGAWQ